MVEVIGTKVSIPGTSGYGILKYIGEIDGKTGVFCGIELVGPIASSRGKNSGIINGIKYFDVRQPMTGLFLPLNRLRTVNSQLDNLVPESVTRTSTSSRPASRTGHVLSPAKTTSKNPSPRVLSPININQISQLPKNVEGHSDANAFDILNQIEKIDLSVNEVSLEEQDNLEQLFQENKNLKEELASFELSNQQCQIELTRKVAVLENSKTTINDLHLLLEKYEKSITEKDKRLDRMRSDFEHSREDWRESLDLLVSTQQENDMVYGGKIDELNAEIDALKNSNDSSTQGRSGLMSQVFTGEEVSSQEEETRKKKSKIDKLSNSHETKVKNDFSQQKQDNSEHSSEIVELRNQLLERNEHLKWLELEISDLKLEIQDLKGTLHLKDNVIEKLRKFNEKQLTLSQGLLNEPQNAGMFESSTVNVDPLGPIKAELPPFFKEENKPLLGSSHSLRSNAKKLDPENHEHNDALSKPPKQLPIYVPPRPADPSEGREGWCGLCERGGHSSINCPYENDIF